jgi:hypothetical protein
MKSYCLYRLININRSCYCKHQGHNLEQHFILSKIFHLLQNYIADLSRRLSLFEKQNYSSNQQYKDYHFSLQLHQWYLSKQIKSIVEIHYAQIKRNPE